MPNDENMDVENIDNEVVETETTQEEQETQEERQLTQEDIDNAVKSRVGRVERKAKRQLAEKDKEIERYKQLENTIRAGLGASDDEDILEKVNSFYKEQGVDIPKYESKFNNRDSERLGELDAQDLIGSAEFDEIQSRANELASLKQSKKISKREEAEFMKLGSYLSSELKLKELKDKGVDEKILEKYFKNIEKVKNGIPIEHITHQKEFMKLSFYVNENVLIPRQDTEVLVEEVISIAKRINAKKILDLCTGSGSIAVSLAKYIENSQITAVDISKEALMVAKKNAKNNNVENQITFVKSDLFNKLGKEKYDIIVSNPPYIKKDVIKKLSKDVQNEPIIALDGGKDGLVFYKKIVNEAIDYLKLGGYLCLEIGYDQKKDVMDLIKENLQYINTYSKKDLYDNDRIVVTKVGG